jgi:hypothetical protein
MMFYINHRGGSNMGYTTEFKGELKFKKPIGLDAMRYLDSFLGKDRRKIGWGADLRAYATGGTYWYHIDYELLRDGSGITWNGAEKAYDMQHIVNFLTKRMKEKGFEDFELCGSLLAQGEDIDDRWALDMVDGVAVKRMIGREVVDACEMCGHRRKV